MSINDASGSGTIKASLLSSHPHGGQTFPSDSHRKRPTPRATFVSKLSTKISIVSLFFIQFNGTLTFYSILSGLIVYLTKLLHYSQSNSNVYINVLTGTSLIFILFGGIISDGYLGRRKTIFYGSIIGLFGLICVSIVTIVVEYTELYSDNTVLYGTLLWFGLYVSIIGLGLINGNIVPFGSDQIENSIKFHTGYDVININNVNEIETERALQRYWMWIYLFINIGFAVSVVVVPYTCKNISYSIGYGIPTISIVIIIVTFLLRYKKYYQLKRIPNHNMFILFFKITNYARKNRKENVFHWLDSAKLDHNGAYDNIAVNDIKAVYKLFVFLPIFMIYGVLYANVESLFITQGCHMNSTIFKYEFSMHMMSYINIMTIIVVIPVLDYCVYPMLRRRHINFSMLQRIGVGLAMIILALLLSSVIEIIRKRKSILHNMSMCTDYDLNVSNISIFWQTPQYILAGLSQVFFGVTQMEFFIGQSPKGLKSVMYVLSLFMIRLGMWLNNLMVLIIDNSDEYLEYYFIASAGVGIINLMIFICYSKKYKYRDGTNVVLSKITQYRGVNDQPLIM